MEECFSVPVLGFQHIVHAENLPATSFYWRPLSGWVKWDNKLEQSKSQITRQSKDSPRGCTRRTQYGNITASVRIWAGSRWECRSRNCDIAWSRIFSHHITFNLQAAYGKSQSIRARRVPCRHCLPQHAIKISCIIRCYCLCEGCFLSHSRWNDDTNLLCVVCIL